MSNFSFAEELLSKKIQLNNFLHMLQAQSSDIICLVGGKEIILYNKSDLHKGMWKKYKEDDEYGFYYINEDNQHITIYSLEADMLLGSIPAPAPVPQQLQSNKPPKIQNLVNNSLQAPIPSMIYQPPAQPIPPQNMYQQNYYPQQNRRSTQQQFQPTPYQQQQFPTTPYQQQQFPTTPYQQQFPPTSQQQFPPSSQQQFPPSSQQQFQATPYPPQQYDAVQAAYYQQNQYIPFYNGTKQDKTSTSTNTKPQKVESKFMA
jgi:hypothetical protein